MPVTECSEDGRPGYKWGENGTCYLYSPDDEEGRKKAKQRAYVQGAAISHSTGEAMKSGAMQHIRKSFQPQALPPLDKEQALAIINRLALEPLSEKDVYIGRAQLANDQIDRSGERFPIQYLERFAETLPGKPVLLGHDKSSVPAGRWFSASIARDTQGVTHLVADFYLDAEGEAARLLKKGIARDVSIGFVAGGRMCDLCGAPVGRDHACESGHRLNQQYDGKRATATYNGDMSRVEALEGSLVGVACQIGAQAIAGKAAGAGQVLESWLTEDQVNVQELEAKVKVLEDELATAKAGAALIEDGKLYHADLKAEIERKLGVLERKAELDLALLESASIPTLKAYDERLQGEINQKFPAGPQSRMLGAGAAPLPELGGPIPKPEAELDPFFMLR